MSEQELNSYRFTSGEEPSDEMLRAIVKEMAREAKERQQEATAAYFADMHRRAREEKARWAERIKAARNG